MSFSIITASYNSMPFIEHCLNSLRGQKDVKFQHVVVDGNSSDGTKEYLAAQKDIRFISEKDKGVYDALNKGLGLCDNEIIGVLHTDDFFADEFVLKDIEDLFSHGADIVYADLEYVSRSNPEKIVRKWKSGSFNTKDLEFGWMPPHPTFFVKREVMEKVGKYNLNYRISSDYDFMLRALCLDCLTASYLARTVIKMRVGGISNSGAKNLMLKMKEDYSIASEYFFSPIGTVILKNLRKIRQFL